MRRSLSSGQPIMKTPQRIQTARRLSRVALGVAALLGTLALPAQAQLRLPSLNTPNLPALPSPPVTTPLQDTLRQTVPLQDLRRSTVRELLRRHAGTLEADPAGEPMRRQELLLIAPAQATIDAALAQGFTLLREQNLAELGLRHVVLRPPAGVGTAQAAERLRALDPQLELDFNHLYTRSGEVSAPAAASSVATTIRPRARVGLIDSGVERRHAALRQATVNAWGCSGAEHPSPHGTAVASLLIGRDTGFAGVLADATLYAADVYCERAAGARDQAVGGSVDVVVQALAWMARERVPVINISLVGPANRLLERAVRALVGKGHLVVAAVGNDGPAAPPLYPASYPGVVGVTGVTTARRVLPEAAQGAQVMLAAPGAELAVARLAGGYVVARGTSFAAPVVAGLLAEALHEPHPQQAAAALAQLAARAVDLGAPGRDPVFGHGCVGEAARTPPERVQARAR
jgi:subtilisin family serine protease